MFSQSLMAIYNIWWSLWHIHVIENAIMIYQHIWYEVMILNLEHHIMVHFVKLNETVPSPPDFNFRQNIKVLDHRCCSQHTSLVLIDEKMWLHFRKKPMFQTILLRMFYLVREDVIKLMKLRQSSFLIYWRMWLNIFKRIGIQMLWSLATHWWKNESTLSNAPNYSNNLFKNVSLAIPILKMWLHIFNRIGIQILFSLAIHQLKMWLHFHKIKRI